MIRFFKGSKTEECGWGQGDAPLGTEKNLKEFFAASPSAETAVPGGKSRLEKDSSSSI
jgi:hypothetical protein